MTSDSEFFDDDYFLGSRKLTEKDILLADLGALCDEVSLEQIDLAEYRRDMAGVEVEQARLNRRMRCFSKMGRIDASSPERGDTWNGRFPCTPKEFTDEKWPECRLCGFEYDSDDEELYEDDIRVQLHDDQDRLDVAFGDCLSEIEYAEETIEFAVQKIADLKIELAKRWPDMKERFFPPKKESEFLF